jgi:hypothetical protein
MDGHRQSDSWQRQRELCLPVVVVSHIPVSRPGNDLTDRLPLIVEALGRLRPRSCIIDGDAVACGGDGIASFEAG